MFINKFIAFTSIFFMQSCFLKHKYDPLDVDAIIVDNKIKMADISLDTDDCFYRNIELCNPKYTELSKDEVNQRLLNKFYFYEGNVNNHFLHKGMVVGLAKKDGYPTYSDECDSLLFSSLRYYSLKELGFNKKAHDAWNSILGAYDKGQWFRHPDCHKTPISRDMFLGLMILSISEPENFNSVLKNLKDIIEINNGFFSFKTYPVSFLSPGLAKTFGKILENKKIDLPKASRLGFATYFVEKPFLEKDFRSHLLAMHTLVEIKLHEKYGLKLEGWVKDAAKELYKVDDKNQFYKYLNYKMLYLEKGIDRKIFLSKLNEIKVFLLESPHFPNDTSPSYCTRGSDYLWQRTSDEWTEIRTQYTTVNDLSKIHQKEINLITSNGDYCSDHYWHGVDLMFLTAVVLKEEIN